MQTDSYLHFEIKEVSDDGSFTGVASVYGVEDLGGDIIDKGAFNKTIADNPTIPVLWQHDSKEVIGQGQISEWQGKILIKGQLDLTDDIANKAYRKIKSKLIKGLSIGYSAIKTMWEEIEGRLVRHIVELKLWEVSIVTFPMLDSAQITRVKTARNSNEFLDICRAWLQAETKSPTTDETRRADLRTVLEKGLALLSDQDIDTVTSTKYRKISDGVYVGQSGSVITMVKEPITVLADAQKQVEADAATGAATAKATEPAEDHSVLQELLEQRNNLWK